MDNHSTPGSLSFRGVQFHLGFPELLATILIIGASLAATFATQPQLGEVGGALIFLLGITLVGACFGLLAALIAAFAAFLLYNFYIAEPILTFRIQTGRDVAPLIVFNLCAIISGILAGRLKDRAQAAHRSNQQLLSLLEVSQALQSAVRLQDIAASLTSTVMTRLGLRIRLSPNLLAGELGEPLDPEAHITELADDRDTASGRNTSFISHRLSGSRGLLGFMVAEADAAHIDPAFMTALSNLVALAIERAILSGQVSEARAAARTEELQTALLSSVSHDFRTPLTAISASASSLIAYREQLDTATSIRLLQGIVEECERLNRYTANLLEMSRLEAGQPQIAHQVLGVSDMIGVVIARLRGRAGSREIVRLPSKDDLLIDADAALFELAITNVLDNAIAYSEDGSRIEIGCGRAGRFCRITVADEGLGIPEHDLERVFDRFVRVARAESSPRGSGLGLAIAKGFVEALGGSIIADTPGIGERGTLIKIRLPLASSQT